MVRSGGNCGGLSYEEICRNLTKSGLEFSTLHSFGWADPVADADSATVPELVSRERVLGCQRHVPLHLLGGARVVLLVGLMLSAGRARVAPLVGRGSGKGDGGGGWRGSDLLGGGRATLLAGKGARHALG